jgi:hypothetical protein
MDKTKKFEAGLQRLKRLSRQHIDAQIIIDLKNQKFSNGYHSNLPAFCGRIFLYT